LSKQLLRNDRPAPPNRRYLLSQLPRLGAGSIPILVEALGNSDREVRSAAVGTLLRICKHLQSPPKLPQDLADGSFEIVGPLDDSVILALQAALQDGDQNIRYYAREALTALGHPPPKSVPGE
jgi:HEAT repeat protein